MKTNINVPWQKVYDFILSCGKEHDLKEFSIKILTGIADLCSFDQSLVYFLDGNRKVTNQYLVNIDKQWSNLYLEYYSKSDNGMYRINKDFREDPDKPTIRIITWDKEPSKEFVPDYIRSRGIRYSMGFGLFDLNGLPRTIFSLDRTRAEIFSDEEFNNVALTIPMLNNLHKKFFIDPIKRKTLDQIPWETTDLTSREIEITNLLCQGVSPSIISESLFISQATTHKHISNIYRKMQVSSLQELLVRLMT